ncbi:MAG: hypothetical protein HN742_01100 [Lentisphaerae bacterium]|nr:hypothetical protein [Lentisphaerota bacterium]MBT5606119.1 hypothetical protein [Lentisphaerota bacterium]MBT7054014.1 hypothetical protein [Lentisphaerota bacterium]MBT7840430.1 hypothetical protein [Lentisphaerota bacterium]
MTKRRRFTIMEAVVACTIGTIILSQAVRLCSRGWQRSCRSIRLARDTQEAQVIAEAWRRVIHPAAVAELATDGDCLTTGTHTITRTQNGALQIRRKADGQTKTFPLSRRTTVTFALENARGPQPLAVLWIHLPSRKARPPVDLRIVACPGGTA